MSAQVVSEISAAQLLFESFANGEEPMERKVNYLNSYVKTFCWELDGKNFLVGLQEESGIVLLIDPNIRRDEVMAVLTIGGAAGFHKHTEKDSFLRIKMPKEYTASHKSCVPALCEFMARGEAFAKKVPQ